MAWFKQVVRMKIKITRNTRFENKREILYIKPYRDCILDTWSILFFEFLENEVTVNVE
jgi:hypothetical protein